MLAMKPEGYCYIDAKRVNHGEEGYSLRRDLDAAYILRGEGGVLVHPSVILAILERVDELSALAGLGPVQGPGRVD